MIKKSFYLVVYLGVMSFLLTSGVRQPEIVANVNSEKDYYSPNFDAYQNIISSQSYFYANTDNFVLQRSPFNSYNNYFYVSGLRFNYLIQAEIFNTDLTKRISNMIGKK